MRFKPKKEDGNENNIFWVTMTDLMTALVLVFIVLFFYSYLLNVKNSIIFKVEQNKVLNEIKQELNKQDIEATVDGMGIVKISDLELFDINSYELSAKGKNYLDKFIPIYLNSIFSNEYISQNIENIVIQGHTDSQMFRGEFTEEEQYLKNMELSLKRAYSVANYMFINCNSKNEIEKLKKILIVEGASFSKPIIENNKENYEKSRRVELKIIMKNSKDTNKLLEITK